MSRLGQLLGKLSGELVTRKLATISQPCHECNHYSSGGEEYIIGANWFQLAFVLDTIGLEFGWHQLSMRACSKARAVHASRKRCMSPGKDDLHMLQGEHAVEISTMPSHYKGKLSWHTP